MVLALTLALTAKEALIPVPYPWPEPLTLAVVLIVPVILTSAMTLIVASTLILEGLGRRRPTCVLDPHRVARPCCRSLS